MTNTRELGSAWKRVQWDKVFSGEIVANRLFLRSGLIRKDLLPLYAPEEAMPWTTIFMNQVSYKSYPHGALNPKGRQYDLGWVLKPNDSSNAWGVQFFHDDDEISPNNPSSDQRQQEEKTIWILQRRINSQKLDGHFFHIRALLLVVGDMDGYLFDDARVLIAVGDEQITNKSYNETFVDKYDNDFHNRSLQIEIEKNHLPASLFKSMRTICAKLLANLDDHVLKNRQRQDGPVNKKAPRHFFTLPNGYEPFGLDFMLDDQSNLLLLEANPEPSMGMWGEERAPPKFSSYNCPISSKVPRSSISMIGFTKIYSRRLRFALAAMSSSSSPLAAA